jgi:hypothetical protein
MMRVLPTADYLVDRDMNRSYEGIGRKEGLRHAGV